MNSKTTTNVMGLCGLGLLGLGMTVGPCHAAKAHFTPTQIRAKKLADYEAKQKLIVARKHAGYAAKQGQIQAAKLAGYREHHKKH